MASNEREMMNNALKKVAVPFLREQGFKGTLPHFRRKNETNIDLITFQFDRWGGSFVVELATCSVEGVTTYWGEQILPNKVTAHDVNERFRLGAKSKDEDGIWFSFEKEKSEEEFEKVAFTVVDLLKIKDRSWITNFIIE
ncbi:DUF4304 domain-containing protein [Lysinibacillus sp. SGAir0095]|uniref:DUF4304 domain-containing protein n=1 Tax=Lysinibacillus sp. SGAir0095 TaxID=2070463 RepID=UPI0010CD5C66|nr:DUF4304 domain-containing protein [Lysinibacillus sp. SGAir0095]QCR33478.1 hypothetical protein C1N55_15550 [Lysinibacillus sp. SGAir0095]